MFEVDSVSDEKQVSGVWRDFNGGKFLIAHMSNLTFQREFSRLQQPYAKKIEKGRLDPAIMQDIMCKAIAKGLLLGWERVGSKDKEIEYSYENAIKLLKKRPDLRDFVQDVAEDLDNYQKEVEDTSGNS